MIPTKEELEREAIPLREKTLAEAEEFVYTRVLKAQVEKKSVVDIKSSDNIPAWALTEIVSKYKDLGYRVSEYGGISIPYSFSIVLNESQLEEEWKRAEGYYKIPDKKWWQFWK